MRSLPLLAMLLLLSVAAMAQAPGKSEGRGVIVAAWDFQITPEDGTGKMSPPTKEDSGAASSSAVIRRIAIQTGKDVLVVQLPEGTEYEAAASYLVKGRRLQYKRSGSNVSLDGDGRRFQTLFIEWNPPILPRK